MVFESHNDYGHSHDHDDHDHDHADEQKDQWKAMENYTVYQQQRVADADAEYRKGKLLSKASELQLEYQPERGEWSQVQVSRHLGYAIKNLELSIHEIPPGKYTATHRHRFQEIIFILKGKGYSFIDGKRFDWQAGDAMAVPMWTWHQHFNADQSSPARYFSYTDAPFMESLALAEIEDKGDAPPLE